MVGSSLTKRMDEYLAKVVLEKINNTLISVIRDGKSSHDEVDETISSFKK